MWYRWGCGTHARGWVYHAFWLTHCTAHMFSSQAPEIDHGVIQKKGKLMSHHWTKCILEWASSCEYTAFYIAPVSGVLVGTSCLLYAAVSSRTSKVIITMPGLGQLSLDQASGFIVKWTTKDHKQQLINTMRYNARKRKRERERVCECAGRDPRGKRGRLRVGQTALKRLRNARTLPDFWDSIKIQTLHEHGELADV